MVFNVMLAVMSSAKLTAYFPFDLRKCVQMRWSVQARGQMSLDRIVKEEARGTISVYG
jgi:hypothetical protein